MAFLVVNLVVKQMALTSLTSLNSLTSPFAKVEFIIYCLKAPANNGKKKTAAPIMEKSTTPVDTTAKAANI